MLLSIRDIPELNWRVLVEQRGTNALAAIRSSLITNSLVGLAVTALTLAIIVYTVNLFYARLETMATTDKLTGIFNRSMFDISVIDALKYQIRDRKRFSIIMLDIDHFKRVNDTHGHLEGDRAFRSIAHLMRKAVRDTDILCRWRGEELVGLARNCSLESAATMAEKIRVSVEAASLVSLPDGSSITVSAGVTQSRDEDEVDSLIGRADSALYNANQDGRNCVRLN